MSTPSPFVVSSVEPPFLSNYLHQNHDFLASFDRSDFIETLDFGRSSGRAEVEGNSSFLRRQESRQTELSGGSFVVSSVEPPDEHKSAKASRSFDRLRMSR